MNVWPGRPRIPSDRDSTGGAAATLDIFKLKDSGRDNCTNAEFIIYHARSTHYYAYQTNQFARDMKDKGRPGLYRRNRRGDVMTTGQDMATWLVQENIFI